MAELKWDSVAFQGVAWKLVLVYLSEMLVDTVKHSFVIRCGQRDDVGKKNHYIDENNSGDLPLLLLYKPCSH